MSCVRSFAAPRVHVCASWLACAAVVVTPLLVGACDPVKLPTEMPGPPGCGMRDPSTTAPPMLSVAQNTTLRNQGTPLQLEDNEHGGKTWIYVRNNGSVFGQTEAADMFIFDKQGLLVGQKTEVRSHVGK